MADINTGSTSNNTTPDEECDYLIIGGGACGMAFVDTLLAHSGDQNLRVVMVDKHDAPGGQWHDSYDFVRLHQPSSGYGVESRKLEPETDESADGSSGSSSSSSSSSSDHRADRTDILNYYADVRTDLEWEHDFEFLGKTTLDLAQLYEDRNPDKQDYTLTDDTTGETRTIRVRKRLVDARNLEPDLPVSTPPKFAYNPEKVALVPINYLVGDDTDDNDNDNDNENENDNHDTEAAAATTAAATTTTATKVPDEPKHFVVIGGGKTGMDAVYHLLTEKQVAPEDLLWVIPNDAWITARENIGNCIDLLHTSATLLEDNSGEKQNNNNNNNNKKKKEEEQQQQQQQEEEKKDEIDEPDTEFFQRGFLEWERAGHVYRLDPSVVPTKFKDATLSLDELETLRTVLLNTIRGQRISEITDEGSLVLADDGSTRDLPFPLRDTLFVHCSAGAFHCSRSDGSPPPIFEGKRIVVRDVYGTPGYCFVGSVLGKLEALQSLSDAERNALAETPAPAPAPEPEPRSSNKPVSGGDVLGAPTRDHPFVQRAHNLKRWLEHPELREWVVSNRLFHMAHSDPTVLEDKLDRTFGLLRKHGILMDDDDE